MADEIDDLLNRLSGKELHVPDLLTLLGNWQTDINSHLGQLRPLVRPMLEAYVQRPMYLTHINQQQRYQQPREDQ
jgi:hypothetical protein